MQARFSVPPSLDKSFTHLFSLVIFFTLQWLFTSSVYWEPGVVLLITRLLYSVKEMNICWCLWSRTSPMEQQLSCSRIRLSQLHHRASLTRPCTWICVVDPPNKLGGIWVKNCSFTCHVVVFAVVLCLAAQRYEGTSSSLGTRLQSSCPMSVNVRYHTWWYRTLNWDMKHNLVSIYMLPLQPV